MNERASRGVVQPGTPLFLERETYRRRRMMDAAGLLPILGVFLFMVPLLWSHGSETPNGSRAIFYIFGVWIALSVLTAIVSIRLREDRPPRGPTQTPSEDRAS